MTCLTAGQLLPVKPFRSRHEDKAMDPIETILVSGRIVAEFEDDASQFLTSEPEFIGVQETKKGIAPATNPAPQANDIAPATRG